MSFSLKIKEDSATTWINLKDIIRSENSQTQKDKYLWLHLLRYIWVVRFTDTEGRSWVLGTVVDGCRVSLWWVQSCGVRKREKSWDIWCWQLYHNMNIFNAPGLYASEWFRVNFVMNVLPQLKRKTYSGDLICSQIWNPAFQRLSRWSRDRKA